MKKIVLLLTFLGITIAQSKADNFMIYSISQDFPMGMPGEMLKKNYYINMGETQGVKAGTELSVYRLISRTNPFAKNKREIVNYKVKVGEIKVLHSNGEHSIAIASNLDALTTPMFFEVNSFMIGDHIDIKID